MNATQASILIVDDDPNHIKFLSAWLRAAGYVPLVAVDGLQAVTIARRQRPDLVLLDIGLPGGGGYSVLRRIKEMPALSDIPVVVLSALDAEENRQKSLQGGAEGYLQKPADLNALIVMIQNILAKRTPHPHPSSSS